ncbi:hypothetical protein Sste5346_004967 [Sporothrix stenoceras]|uniref:SET domain-containing protein n=1 Tax=Sporothrix stenoceras TaxID=5173 RepID=A0ABR3Z5G0_9PEZI
MDQNINQSLGVLQNQKKVLQNAKKDKGKKPWPALKRSRRALEDEFTSLAGEIASMSIGVPTAFIGESYPPCTKALFDLTSISIDELLLETHHRGRALVARTFSLPNRITAIQTAIEDEYGNVERLAVYNLLPGVKPETFFPPGTIVAIKEPYYKRTADGGMFVRVDHPSDLVFLPREHPLIPVPWRTKPLPYFKQQARAVELKELGNKAFGKKQWAEAEALYSDSYEYACDLVATTLDDDFASTVSRNRAAARLHLGRYELAIEDALNGIVRSQKGVFESHMAAPNTKALYRAGQAAYGLRDFDQAQKHFQTALDLHKEKPANEWPPEIVDGLDRTKKRLHEEIHGYNDDALAAMAKEANAAYKTKTRDTCLDHASFVSNTRIGPSEGKGQGLFTTKAIKAGDVVFIEKAFHSIHADSVEITGISLMINVNSDRITTGTPSLLLAGLTDKLMWNPKLANQYFALYDGSTRNRTDVTAIEVPEIDGSAMDKKAPVDTFCIQAIVELNAFAFPRVSSRASDSDQSSHEKSAGVWLHAAHANHACIPNATRSFIGDMMVVRAVRDLAKGEEVFMTYLSVRDSFEKRQKEMAQSYGFNCECRLCVADHAVGTPGRYKRARLVATADKFIDKHRIHVGSNRQILNKHEFTLAVRNEGARLLGEIAATYPIQIYGKLPKFNCIDLDEWLLAISPISVGPSNADRALRTFLETLQHMGYFVTVNKNGTVHLSRESAVALEKVIHFARNTAMIFTSTGKSKAAAGLTALAKEVYTIRRGTSYGFEEAISYA